MRFAILPAFLALVFPTLLSAQTVIDQGTSGVQDNGTLTGAAAITADARFGSGAVSVPSGSGNHVQLVQPVTDLDMDAGYTFMTWFKQTTPGEKGLIGLGSCCTANEGDARNGYTLNLTSSTEIRFWGGSTPNDNNHNTTTPSIPEIANGDWHHAAIRVQPGQVDIFVNGVIVVTNSASNIPTQPSRASVDGGCCANFVPHIGGDEIDLGADAAVVIDEVRVYGAVLTDQQVLDAMMNVGPLPDRLYYTFDDDTVANDGTLQVNVTKTFSNGDTGDVEVMLTCNGGIPLQQNFTISGDGPGVTFSVTDLPDTGANCEVTESGGNDGYMAVMNGGSGCSWTGLTGGLRSCAIENTPEATTVSVGTTVDTDGEATIDPTFTTTIVCQNVSEDTGSSFDTVTVTDTSGLFEADWYADPVNGADCTVMMVPNDMAVEGDSCAFSFAIGDAEAGCDVAGTVFFEGIPTMSQYGLAIMALLMLGIGFVGFRRFV